MIVVVVLSNHQTTSMPYCVMWLSSVTIAMPICRCLVHCGKALIRSGIWDPDGWPVHDDSPMVAQVVDVLGGDPSLVPIVSAQLEQNDVDDL